jgi:hypothetical protein
MRSVRVVFPESICADTPILRWYFNRWLSASVSWNRCASEGVSVTTFGGNFRVAVAAEAWRRGAEKDRAMDFCNMENEGWCTCVGRSGSIDQ